MSQPTLDFICSVLAVAERYDCRDSLFWRTDGEFAPVTFWVNCNDLFYWACSDLEQITPENLPMLSAAFEDCRKATEEGVHWGGELFCARVRGMRPQRPAYPKNHSALWPLFDACGEPR